MKILVTGSAGFIGFHLCRKLLKNGHNVIGVDNLNKYYDVNLKKRRVQILKTNFKNKFIFKKIDISKKKEFKPLVKIKFDIIVNLAAQAGVRYSLENPQAYIDANLIGFFNVLEFSKMKKIKHLLYASTSSVYGANENFPYKERNSADNPIQLYAATKRSNELMAHSYSHLFNLPTTGLRFFTVYGPYGRPDMALFKFTKNILNNKKIEVYNYGNHYRDFTYVDDLVDTIAALIIEIPKKKKWNKKKPDPSSSTAPFEIYNIGNNNPIKLTKYIEILEKVLGKKAKKKYLKLQAGDIKKTFADNTKIKKIYSKKFTDVNEGIKKFVTWYREYYNE
ncbi:SDR family NAD(P)-dependent oxidoreductase [Candidatus Pelagibacter sp.]|uniref:SDR family NAD(P)-dependent oxidoreductase n=1 Tax=Candidatus Pelagibacter sp. TaxID=2024849 RepID=UPI003F84A855